MLKWMMYMVTAVWRSELQYHI